MKEIWRNIPGIDVCYFISNKNGWRNTKKTKNKQPKGIITNGYRSVSVNGKKRMRYHILVAMAFPDICGEWFDGCHVHHINGNSLDNRPENLVVISASEHSKLHYKTQSVKFKKPSPERSNSISKALKGKTRPDKCIPVLQKDKNGIIIRKWTSITQIHDEKGYSCGNISMCCHGKLKQAYGYLWEQERTSC